MDLKRHHIVGNLRKQEGHGVRDAFVYHHHDQGHVAEQSRIQTVHRKPKYGKQSSVQIHLIPSECLKAFLRKAAADLVCSMVEKGAAVSWGGSETIKELGVLERLKEDGCEMIEYPEKEKISA